MLTVAALAFLVLPRGGTTIAEMNEKRSEPAIAPAAVAVQIAPIAIAVVTAYLAVARRRVLMALVKRGQASGDPSTKPARARAATWSG